MTVILVWLGRQAPLIYLACLLGALVYAVMAISAKRRRNFSQFSLEREIYQQRLTRSWLISVLFLALAGVVFMISAYISPTLDALSPSTPTPVAGLVTPTTTLPAPTATITATTVPTSPIVAVTQGVATEVPILEPTATPEEPQQPDCPSPNAQLIAPVAGSSVSGIVEVQGTAKMNSFSYYKFEVQFPGSDTPNFISQYNIPVENGPLGTWDITDSTAYPVGGPYRFRLVVVDIYGNTLICTVPVYIAAPEDLP